MARDWDDVAAEIAAKRIEDREARIYALLGVCEDCAGLPATQLTPRKLLLLELCGNAFLVGGAVEAADVAQFLWIVSPKYTTNSEAAREFAKTVGDLDFKEAAEGIQEWLEIQMIDLPTSKSTGMISGRVWVAQYVDLFASEYGWTESHILDMPVLCLGQYKNEIIARLSGTPAKEPTSSREDRLKSEWLKEVRNG